MTGWRHTAAGFWAISVGLWLVFLSLSVFPDLIEVLAESTDGIGFGERVVGIWMALMVLAGPGYVVYKMWPPSPRAHSASDAAPETEGKLES